MHLLIHFITCMYLLPSSLSPTSVFRIRYDILRFVLIFAFSPLPSLSTSLSVAGLPDGSINIKLTGHGGQSLGFALAKGVSIDVEVHQPHY